MPFDQPPLSDETTDSLYKNHWWSRMPTWSKVIVLPLTAGFIGMSALLIGLRAAPLPDESLANPTLIDSADGTRLAEWTIKGTRSEHVALTRIPQALQAATIAVEDARFYEHSAFSPLSMMRAIYVDLRHGRIEQGGSTITQQLAKNLFLNQDRTLSRKMKEALYAIQLELHESKQTILEQYLNYVYYGHGAYGVGAAAKLYFNKPVEELTLPECAMLAGLPKGPSLYSPLDHFDNAKTRQRLVLDRMAAAGYLTRAEADRAFATPLKLSTVHAPLIEAPYFTSTAIREVEQQFHVAPEDLYQGDIHITTTLDPVLQHAAERAITTTIPAKSGLQAVVVAMDPKTGAIKAMVGGRDFGTSPYNRVFAERQPGSTFKAALYATALEEGWTPTRRINSEETTFFYDHAKRYTVHDYGEFYAHRPLTLREALARSDNVYAVSANMEIGPAQVAHMAQRLGITSEMLPYPSLALGVFPTSPLQMATVYATFANGGYHVTPYTVSEIRDARSGRIMKTESDTKQVISKQIAFQMSDLLRSVLEPNGTGYAVHNYLHSLAAAKTGTTNTDSWMVGYTPNIVCAVWVGYDDNKPLTLSESHLAAPIWAKFMGTAQQRLPVNWYDVPKGVVQCVIDPSSGQLATDTCGTTETDYFIRGTQPVEFCALHPSSKQVEEHKKGLFGWLRGWL